MILKMTKFSWWKFLRENINHPLTKQHNFFYLLKYWLKGFRTESIVLLDFRKNNYKNVINDACKYRITLRTNKNVWPVLHDKIFFDYYMREKLPIIPALFFISDKKYNPVKPNYTLDTFIEELKHNNSYVLKPVQGGMGQDIHFVKFHDNNVFLDGKESTFENVIKMINNLEYHVCCPFMVQHKVLAKLYSETTNTIRVTTYTPEPGVVEFYYSILRVGTKETIPVDNTSKGGISVNIDIETGITKKAIQRTANGEKRYVETHPQTQERFEGVQIPFWNEIKETIVNFHKKYPSFDYVGWDVLITDQTFYFVEGNHNPALTTAAVHKNCEFDPVFYNFLKSKDIVK